MNRAFILNERLISVIMHMNEATTLFRPVHLTDDAPVVVFSRMTSDYG